MFSCVVPLPGMCPASKAMRGTWQELSKYWSEKYIFKKTRSKFIVK